MIEARVVLAGEGRTPVAVGWDARGGPPPAAPRLVPAGPEPRPLPTGPEARAPRAGRAQRAAGARPLSPTRKVVSVVDSWRYDGRWWEALELHRDYYLLELDGGTHLELFSQGGTWWAARASD